MKLIKNINIIGLPILGVFLLSANSFGAEIHSLAPLADAQKAMKPIGIMTLGTEKELSTDYLVKNKILTKGEAAALPLVIQASNEMHKLFLYQNATNGEAIYNELKSGYKGVNNKNEYFDYFRFNWTTWDSRNDHAPFINLDVARRPGLNFYPADITPGEVKKLSDNPALNGFFTVVKRSSDNNRLFAVPYSQEYASLLSAPASLLHQAAKKIRDTDMVTNCPAAPKKSCSALATFLDSRADAFASNDYRPSDVDWLNLNGKTNLLVTIGPYETYYDELLGLKATFMSMITVKDVKRESEVQFLTSNRDYISGKFSEILPQGVSIGTGANDYQLKGSDLGVQFVYVNEIYSAGDYRQGASIGFFLPNDELAPGARNHIVSNAGTYKGLTTLLPIGQIIAPGNAEVNVNDFNDETTLHEFGHSMEPKFVGGTQQVPRELLAEQTNTISEATADSFGVNFHRWFIELGSVAGNTYATDTLTNVYMTQLASIIRTLRFGFVDSHARGAAIQIKWLLENHNDPVLGAIEPAITLDADGLVKIVDNVKFTRSYQSLNRELLRIQFSGDYSAAKALREAAVADWDLSTTTDARIKKIFANVDNAQPSIPADFIKVYPVWDSIF